MPKLLAKVEGKGNGIKTVIVNMPEIAKSLNRPPMYPTKYFGCLLGAQVNFDNKSERYIVSGAQDTNILQDLLDRFIQDYVACQSCGNHDTTLSVEKKKSVISLDCRACGKSGTIAKADASFAAYILKNPPPKTTGAPTNSSSAGNLSSRLGPVVQQGKGSEDCNQDDEVDDLDSDDLEELDYGDDDDYELAQSQTMEQGSSSQPTRNDSTSHQDDEDDEEAEDEDEDDLNHDVDADESLDADRKEDDRAGSDAEKDGDKVRCRYWPSCTAQESCQFYHPTKKCRDFLRCTYGDRCLYIHPPCKFSPNCTKPNCPFSHPAVLTTGVKRKASAMQFGNLQQQAAPKCKFGFKCLNIMCKFSHQPSEDCRYGTNCLLENCPYTHPTDSMPRKKAD